MKQRTRIVLALTACIALCTVLVSTASADEPLFGFHAEVYLEDGSPLTEDVSMYLEAFASPEGGEPIWSKFYLIVSVVHGSCAMSLGGGDVSGMLDALAEYNDVYLEFVIQGKKLTPRIGIYQVPYAHRTFNATGMGGRPASDYAIQGEGFADVADTGSYADIKNTPDLATVAISGKYDDLSNKPALSPVALDGSWGSLAGHPANLSVTGNTQIGGDLKVDGIVDAANLLQGGEQFKGSSWVEAGHTLSYTGDANVAGTVNAKTINTNGEYLVNGAPLQGSPWKNGGPDTIIFDGNTRNNGSLIRNIQFHYTDDDRECGSCHFGMYDWHFTKRRDDTALWIQWYDNFRCISQHCMWRIRLDGHDCNDPRNLDMALHRGENFHEVSQGGGICKQWGGAGNPPAGDHKIEVHEVAGGSHAYLGWSGGSYFVIEEIYADQK